jgi:alpha-N-arabinofuranosidase
MPINRRELLKASVAGAAMVKQGRKALAAPPENIQVTIDASKAGAPVNPMIFGGYMEPATTRVWAEMLTDRKFANAIVPATAAAQGGRGAAGGGMARRFGGDPFWPVGPADAVEMDTVRPFVGKQSPRIKLAGSDPRGIQASGLRVAKGKSYIGRVWLAGDSGAKVVIRLVWGEGLSDSQTITAPPLTTVYQKVPLKFMVPVDSQGARLEIVGTGSGAFHVGTASLMPADNVQGFHAGMIRYFKEQGFKMAKWPGGNFVSGYDWYDGLGDVDKRPPRFQAMWSGRVESNDVGLHEYIAFCRLLGAEPDLTINSGFGAARDAAEEVEYCNGSGDTRLGRLRAQNGHPEPFNVRYWTIGNEMYGPWQFGYMSLNQYWVKHNYIVEAMKKVDPKIKVTLVGASICEASWCAAEQNQSGRRDMWRPPLLEKLPFEFGGHEDWDGWLLAHCADDVDFVSEHTYAYPGLAFDAEKQHFVDAHDPLPMQARRSSNRIGEAFEAWQKYVEKMPNLKAKGIKFIFDEWGCRYRSAQGVAAQAPGMLTPLSYALLLNEIFRHSDMVEASCATGGLGTVLIDNTGEATGLSAEGMVLKIMQTHFGGAFPVEVSGNSPQQPVDGTPFVDKPNVPIGSPTYPLDVLAAFSGDRKKLLISVVNPTEEVREFTPRLTGVKLRGPGKLSQIAPPGVDSANRAGQKPVVEIIEHPQQAFTGTVQAPPVSINVYEFEIESA